MACQIILATKFIEEPLKYDGSQLQSHFAYKNCGVRGDSIVSFIGPCEVKLDSLVDLEDVVAKKFIFSHSMVHFIVEHFDDNLTETICRQRLLMSVMQEELQDSLDGVRIKRVGDDLFDDQFKLTVSIATSSPVSTLIHAAINIQSEDTPLPTRGLADYKLNPQAFARAVMNRYVAELQGIAWARAKVRAVV